MSESRPPCTECSNGQITHPELYVYECNICGFKYRIDPAAKKENIIEILKKSILEVRK